MKTSYSPVLKISFTLLYLLTLLAEECRSVPEDDFHQPFLSLYYNQIDNFVAHLMKNPYTSIVEFQNTFAYQNHSAQLIKEKEKALTNLNHQIEETKKALANKSNISKEESTRMGFLEELYQSQQNSLTELARVVPVMRVVPRYNNVDSYIWNSLIFDFNQSFQETEKGAATSHFFYPSSLISLPVWKTLGESMNLWMVPHNNFNYEFIAISAPVHANLNMPPEKILPKKVSLNNRTSSDMSFLNPNPTDMNMVYFFKMIFDQNVRMVIAICSDPELESDSNPNFFKFQFKEDLGVMNKCHLYWRVEFDITFNGEQLSVSSRVLEDEQTDLYRVYLLTISAEANNFQHEVRIYVLFEWPDHEKLPDNMIESQLQLYDIMYRRLNPLEDSPKERILIHCSAGVGRTGTTILGYQMYSQLRMVTSLNLLNPSTSFYSFIQNYKISKLSEPMIQGVNNSVLSANDPNMKSSPQDKKTLGEMINIFTNSKLMWYLMDSLFYYRCRRMWFVQTVDQFEFLIKFAQILNIKTIKMQISSGGSLISGDGLDEIDEMMNVYNPMFRQHILKLVNKDSKPQNSSDSGKTQTKLSKQESIVKDTQSNTKSNGPSHPKVHKTNSVQGVSKPAEVKKTVSQESQKTKMVKSETQSKIKETGGISMSQERLDKLKSKLSQENIENDLRLI